MRIFDDRWGEKRNLQAMFRSVATAMTHAFDDVREIVHFQNGQLVKIDVKHVVVQLMSSLKLPFQRTIQSTIDNIDVATQTTMPHLPQRIAELDTAVPYVPGALSLI